MKKIISFLFLITTALILFFKIDWVNKINFFSYQNYLSEIQKDKDVSWSDDIAAVDIAEYDILYFSRQDCIHCNERLPMLAQATKNSSKKILFINTHGKENLPGVKKLISDLEIEVVPSLFIVKEDKVVINLSNLESFQVLLK